MPTVELHHPRQPPVKVRQAVVDRWLDAGWELPDNHTCPHCETTAKSAGGLQSHIRAKHDNQEE